MECRYASAGVAIFPFATLVAFVTFIAGAEANGAQTFECKTLDGIKVGKGGTFQKLPDNEFGAYKTLVIDTVSAVVTIGDGQTRRWVIEQTKVDGYWDFVAKSTIPNETRREAVGTIRLRVVGGTRNVCIYLQRFFFNPQPWR